MRDLAVGAVSRAGRLTWQQHHLVAGLAQRLRLEDPDRLGELEEIMSRIGLEARLRDVPEPDDEAEGIEIFGYLRGIVAPFRDASGPDQPGARVTLRGSRIRMAAREANALALIVHELLSNAAEHGRCAPEPSQVEVSLSPLTARTLYLSVADRGPGFPVRFDPWTSPTAGMRIVTGLARHHGATLEIGSSGPGARVLMRWPVDRAIGPSGARGPCCLA